MKKNRITYFGLLVATLWMSACSDFFRVETDDLLDQSAYINEESEMYSGFIGIITRLQTIGDKAIYLTDTRSYLLEPTRNTTNELYALYNYDEDLAGNSYADPAPYYDVIIACNDYMDRLRKYKEANPTVINQAHYIALISSAVRIKAWMYFTMAKIYGNVYWFDDVLVDKVNFADHPDKFKELDLNQTMEACLNLMDNGYDGINGDSKMAWKQWLDPNTDLASSQYRYWDVMTPEPFVLRAELALWRGEYQRTVDLILGELNRRYEAARDANEVNWYRNDNLRYAEYWNNSSGPYEKENISSIVYSYQKNQTNHLCEHFGFEYPNKYLLRPSETVIDSTYRNPKFDPVGLTADGRLNTWFAADSQNNNEWYVRKFRPRGSSARPYPYQDDVPIYIYRASELFTMLAEGLNNLGRHTAAMTIIGDGVNSVFPGGGVTGAEWAGFTDWWTARTPAGTGRKYNDMGFRGYYKLPPRTNHDDTRLNDMEILNEIMLEYPCEGKVYPAMVRMALRYNDPSIIADRVCLKYGANADAIRAKIMAGGYFINWDLEK